MVNESALFLFTHDDAVVSTSDDYYEIQVSSLIAKIKNHQPPIFKRSSYQNNCYTFKHFN